MKVFVASGAVSVRPADGLSGLHPKDKAEWWANDEIINAKIQKGPEKGEALIEVRQGLVDRSKSPFYLVNNADYEAIQ